MNYFHPAYLLFVGVGVLVALAFPVTRHIREDRLRRQYYLLQGITILGAILGAKISVLVGDQYWPWVPVNDWHELLWSGRSITGALIGGFLFAEIAKPLIGYTMPPNDRFAALLPFTLATGRVGCLLAGCCGGLPYDGWGAVHDAAGVARYPTQLIEIVFQLAVGVAFQLMVRRRVLCGHLFAVYLMMYGAFRFLTEFIRDTPKFFDGYSGYQLLSVVMILLGAAFFLKRKLAPPPSWRAFNQPNAEASHV